MQKSEPRVYITKSFREWQVIEKRISELGSKDFPTYLSKKISSLCDDFTSDPQAVCDALFGEKIQRQQRVSSNYAETMENIALMTGIPMSTIVDRLIITPLLIEK